MRRFTALAITAILLVPASSAASLAAQYDADAGTITVLRIGETAPILTQHAELEARPFIYSIVAPNGGEVFTKSQPDQTGLFWGLARINGRDYFESTGAEYWRRVGAGVLKPESTPTDLNVKWQTVYDLLDDAGAPILRETQTWTMHEQGETFVLELEWRGEAITDVTIGKQDYGGLFLRNPWRDTVNSARQSGDRAEGQRAVWLDVAMPLDGRDDLTHIAIFDHPKNEGYPQPWHVDKQVGVGPVMAGLQDRTINAGDTAVIRHQLRIYAGTLSDVALTEAWSTFAGVESGIASAQWGIAKQEGRDAEFLTPAKALAAMTLQDGFEAQVFASEPMITQPMAFCWDDRGRLWIAENRDYAGRGKGSEYSGESRISILEDSDRDGIADTKKVFLDRVINPSAMAVGLGGLWLGSIPNLLFVPDRDGDDRADEDDIEIRLTGWGKRDMHEILNSLHWGPDGWIYGLQGVFTPSRVGKPAGKSAVYRPDAPYPESFEYEGDPIDINGGVWRYHPTKDRFEVVAHGVSNPWGIDYDAKGQLFISACVIPHLWHVVQGGLYHRQAGSHFNAHAYSDIRTIGDHRHRSAHGGARIYLSDAFPERYRGQIFMGNIHEHAVLVDTLERSGSGFVGRHGEDFMLANNAQFVGFSTEIGPDGAIYMLDWHDADICGDIVRTKDTGRVYRIAPKPSHADNWDGRYADLKSFTDTELVNLQLSASAWHARRARVILHERAISGTLQDGTHDALRDIFDTNANADHRLRALWALHVTAGIRDTQLVSVLNDNDEYIRAWAIQMLCEDLAPSNAARDRFAVMAANDASPVVRLYLASALQRMDLDDRWSIASNLVKHADDATDHNIPKLLWYGIEPLVPADPKRALALAEQSRIPIITQYIARRLTAANELDALIEEIGRKANARDLLLVGMRDGLEGRHDASAPKNWPKVYSALRTDDETASLALEISLLFGDAVAAEALVNTLRDHSASLDDRRQALRGLAERKRPELKTQLLTLIDDEALRRDAIRAIASFDDESLGKTVLERYETFTAAEKQEVVHALASRPNYGTQLMDAIDRGDVPRRDIPAYIARLLFRVVGNRFLEVWGPVEDLSPDVETAFTRYQTLLNVDTLANADPRRGREVFRQTCHACHQLYGEGGMVGPDLTGANRTDVDYLLGNILTPSAIIQDDYKMTMVFTEDGQVYSGVVAGEDDGQVTLRTANVEAPIKIPKSQITDREVTELSMMPEGLLEGLSDEELADLFAYLGSLEPVRMQEWA